MVKKIKEFKEEININLDFNSTVLEWKEYPYKLSSWIAPYISRNYYKYIEYILNLFIY